MLAYGISAASNIETADELTSVGAQVQETSLGSLVADAVRKKAGTPVAIIAAGSLKEITIAAGRVDPDDVAACLQYPEDKIAVIELTGKQLLSAFERSLQIQPQKNMGFLQVSGIKIKFNPNSPKGARTEVVEIGSEKLDPAKKYPVAMTVPLADGAYGYFTIWGKEKQKIITDADLSTVLARYISSAKHLDYTSKDRIIASK